MLKFFFLIFVALDAKSNPLVDQSAEFKKAFREHLQSLPENFHKKFSQDEKNDYIKTRLSQVTSGSIEEYFLKKELYNQQSLKFSSNIGDPDAQREICMAGVKPRAADLDYRYLCLESQVGHLKVEHLVSEFMDLFKAATVIGEKKTAINVLMSVAWLHSSDGNIAESLAVYEKAQKMIGKEEIGVMIPIKLNLATIYIVHGDQEYVRKGILILKEVQSMVEKIVYNKKLPLAQAYYDAYFPLSSMNLGVAYTIHLHEYEKAIDEFAKAAKSDLFFIDSYIFSALAASELGRPSQAKSYLEKVEGKKKNDPVSNGYLNCYKALAKRKWQPEVDLGPCFQLHSETALEVLKDINKRLIELPGAKYRTKALEQYVKMSENKIEPELYKRTARAASRNELKRLEIESRLKDEQIKFGKKIKKLLYVVSGISVLLFFAVILVSRATRIINKQSKQIERQRRDLQHILDHIDEGIILINDKMKIKPVYSKFSKEIVMSDLDKLSVWDLLDCLGFEKDALAICHEVLKISLGDDSLNWGVNSLNLPLSGEANHRYYNLHWTPIVEDDRVMEVILSIRDATDMIKLREESEAKERIIVAVGAGNLGYKFIHNLKDEIENLMANRKNYPKEKLLRAAHTAKGEARSLNFKVIANYLHEFEQLIIEDKLTDSPDLVNDLFNEIGFMEQSYDAVTGKSEQVERLLNLLQPIFLDANKRLLEHGFKLNSKVQCQWLDLSPSEFAAIHKILSHAISNSVDHGFIYNKNKESIATDVSIQVKLWEDNGNIFLEVVDTGGGINWEALAKKADELGIKYSSQEELGLLVFKDSVSSMDSVKATSGRGVGMAVVAEAAEELGARLSFNEVEGQGTVLSISWASDRKDLVA